MAQIHTDKNKLLHADLTYQIRGAIYEVANQYGKGLKEQIYQGALAEEFSKRQLPFEEQKRITITSVKSGKSLGVYVPDFVIAEKIVVELKASEFTSKQNVEQQLSYLKGSQYEVGFLVNFGSPRLYMKRFIFTNDRKSSYISRAVLSVFIGILLSVFIGGQAQATVLSRPANNLGLVGYWSLDDASGTQATDFSGNGNTGTLAGMESTDWVSGKRGGALSFDGTTSEYIDLGTPTSLEVYTTLTVSAWIRSTEAADARQFVVAKDSDSGNRGWGLGLSPDNKLYVEIDGLSRISSNGPAIAGDNQWHHILFTNDNGSVTGYLDGSFIATSTTGLGANSSAETLIAMRGYSGFEEPFQGDIDEVRIYGRVLTATEITALYGTGTRKLTAPDKLGLIGHWSFEDATGTQATDFSGNGRTGTLTGGPVFVNGKRGKALSFDGDNDVVNISLGTSFSRPLTFAFWKKGAWGTENYIQASAYYDNFLIYDRSNGSGQIQMFKSLTDEWGFVEPQDGLWHHIAFVIDADGTRHIYFDGASHAIDGYVEGSTSNPNTSTDIKIGSGFQAGSLVMDDVRIYNRALSETEIAALAGAGSGAVRTNAPNNNGLLGYWSFEDATGTQATDFSGKGNTGTLVADAAWTNGKKGKALSFDGTGDYVNIPDTAALRPGAGSISMAYWFKTSNASQFAPILAKRNSDNYNQIQTGVGKIIAGNGSSSKNIYIFTYGNFHNSHYTSAEFIDGNWHHVVAIRPNSGSPLIYVDGVAAALTEDINSGVTTVNNDYSWQIGNSHDANYFNGQVDDVRIYNRVLTASEVSALYNTAR